MTHSPATSSPASPAPAGVSSCGACQHENLASAQYCGGCGHALFESCPGCGNAVSLTQKFCVSCGKDLVEQLRGRQTQQEGRFAEAVASAKRFEYAKALSVLQPIAEQTDYRFAELADRARQAQQKIRQLQQRMVDEATTRMQQAETAHRGEQYQRVIDLLSVVPEQLLDDASRTRLNGARRHLEQTGSLQGELQQALAEKNYLSAAGLVHQLLEILPQDPKLQQLAGQLAEKLQRKAEKQFTRQDYTGACDTLQSVPMVGRTESYRSLWQRIETVRWLSEQFQDEPFATGTLGRLAIRFSKAVPQDGNASTLVKELAAAVKGKRRTARDGFATWRGPTDAWAGGPLHVFAHPQSFDLSELDQRPASFAEYGVAIGLALQGLGLSRVSGNLIEKKGMFAKLGLSKSKTVWGVDVGSFAVHAVHMRVEKGKPKPLLLKAISLPLKTPSCRAGGMRVSPEQVSETLKTLVEQIDSETQSVWANLPASDSVARFCELPPVKDKEVERLVSLEAKGRIPIDAQDLALLTWRAELDKSAPRGRPLVMAAATKITVTRRVDWLGAAGLKVDGLVPEGIALANFAASEFADVLGTGQTEEGEDGSEETGQDSPSGTSTLADDAVPTVALLDVGASKTMLILVSPISLWYWSHETGGEDVTTLVARHAKRTAEEADQVKRNLAALDLPDVVDAEIAEKQAAQQIRLTKMMEEARKTFRHMQVTQTWCVGGGQFQHGFHRRVASIRRRPSA